VRNEKRMLQESVDALFDNGRRGRVITGANKRPLKSLSDMLKGKQGRFRQNLLGKRVDFSGRSVIVTGPELKLHQCGLPKKMALELFKPFIYSRLEAKGLSSTVKQAKKLVEKERPEVWDILDEVIREHPVMLNRAPTLHRLGIQAFEPVLIEGKAIQLHPLVCSAFNADFDGDQMAVHVPLSLEAQLEARVLMMSTNNVLSPANGAPIIVPSQDMILGLYYTTIMRDGMKGEGMVFSSIDEVQYALDSGEVHLHAKITARIPQIDENGLEVMERVETTPGRVRLGSLLPQNNKAPFALVNKLLRKKDVQNVIDTVYRYCGQKESVIFCDQIMTMGFREAFKAGISFGKDDMVIPEDKWTIVDGTRDLVKDFEQQYMDGLITQGEKYNKVVDAWSKCNDKVTDAMMNTISDSKTDADGSEAEPNSVYMMAHSGARGSVTQMKQLGGMRGLMAKPNGDIIETPIISNFKEGLTVLEYFNSTHGARKGLSDTALKTANSGYLTRRLVDVAQDCIVRARDCGTDAAITAEAAVNDGEVVASLAERVLGRVAAEDILKPGTDEVIVAEGQLIDERTADAIDEAGVQSARIRSPLTCEAEEGVCAMCYGRDLARGTMVNTGEAVGIIAAQSIGEPGTQLTMRTFHIGGVAQGGQQSFLEASQEGKIFFENAQILENANGEILVMGRGMKLKIIDEAGDERANHKVGYGSKLFVKDGQKIGLGDKLFEWDPYTLPILAEKSGTAKFVDLVSGIAVRDETDEATGMTQKIVTDWRAAPKGNELKPEVILVDADGEPVRNDAGNPVHYPMSVDAILSIEEQQDVQAGDVIARIPREGAKTKDITGGLPRVAELFEARRPKDHAIIAEIDGYVRFGRDYKNKRRISIEPSDESMEPVEYMVPKGKHIPVQEGDFVQKGDYIMDGNPAPHDILSIMGVEALADYMIDEVQDVYRLQGVKINDKHIEVIVRQMLQKWEIQDSGETTLLKGEHVEKMEFDAANEKALSEGRRPAQGEPILLGITKASLQTRSFISAASFQETTRVLTEASVQGKKDKLVGLKENVIVGRLIPAGTGGATQQVRRVASDRDNVVIEARREEAEAAAALAAPVADVQADDVFSSGLVETPESRELD
jgi:DNA-directed RNA polymerase subunit beta'